MAYELVHRTDKKTSPGKFYPLGAALSPEGANFALYSQSAKEVYLLLFDRPGNDPADIIRLEECTRHIWHVFVHGLKAGQLYGYKVKGEFNPGYGLRFNERKLLLDPYARAFTGKLVNSDNLLLGYDAASPAGDMSLDDRDNTAVVPKCILVDDAFDWQGDRHPDIPFEKLVVYEVHVKGFTADQKSSGVKNPGTYLGFIERIPHLRDLGVNAVELLPVHEYYVEDFLAVRKLTNYWGYNTVGFFAPESSYSTGTKPGCQVEEFKTLVRELHRAGIEVILDVVYNHTGEGNENGTTVCFKGIDNPTYYCLTGTGNEPRRYYMNYTGCGNSLNLAATPVIRMVMDSLRYWVEVMHVDGFRFDLASVLGREEGMFRSSASFFDAASQDPVISRVKLIAEPWDIGTYQVGNFPVDWAEWNGRFRDTVRRFVKGDGAQVRELGWRLTGSADLYGDDGRSAYNSVNFITCHDGFTLNDLVSYNWKHNEENLENNNDGTSDNFSWNCGYEGETDDGGVMALRKQMAKNHLCALLFSVGIPMLLGGDEFLRTQKGNNNAYCQDNNISWFDWSLVKSNADMLSFCTKAITFRKRYGVLQRKKYLAGRDMDGNAIPDISWFGRDGGPVSWDDAELRAVGYLLDGGEDRSDLGSYLLYFLFNADHLVQYMNLPSPLAGKEWRRVVDTSIAGDTGFLDPGKEMALDPQDHYLANPRSTVVLLCR